MTFLPTGHYDVVLADPPWSHYGDPRKDQAAGKHYTLMSDAELASLGVGRLLAPGGVLFLWATCPRLDAAVDVIRSWGLHYRGVAFVWVKTRKDGIPVGAQGVRPSIVKPVTELCLAASRVKRGRPRPVANESIRQVVLACRPAGVHSRKPTQVHERIESLYPDARKLELFARDRRDGWDAWGNQLDATEVRP